jgi:PilZ domain
VWDERVQRRKLRRTPASGVPTANSRRHPRIRLAARCWIGDGRRTVYMRVHDLSRGGLSVRAPVPFAPADAVELRLELPGGRTAHARGEIVWVRPPTPSSGEHGARMGARFSEWLAGEDDLYNLLPAA